MILSDRSKELILGMCSRYDQGMYVDGAYLREHDVSADETVIFDTVATLLRGICRLPDSEVMKLIMLGTGAPAQVAYDAFNIMRLDELSKMLSDPSCI